MNNNKENIKSKFKQTIKKDANLSMFVFGPFFLLFYIILAYNSNWPKILSIIFTIIVVTITFFVFYYSIIVKRGKLMQRIAKEIIVNGNKLDIKSFGWYFKKQKEYHFDRESIINASEHFKLFKYEGIKMQIETDTYKAELLIVNDFFDNLKSIIPGGS